MFHTIPRLSGTQEGLGVESAAFAIFEVGLQGWRELFEGHAVDDKEAGGTAEAFQAFQIKRREGGAVDITSAADGVDKEGVRNTELKSAGTCQEKELIITRDNAAHHSGKITESKT